MRRADLVEQRPALGSLYVRESEQHVLGGDVLVAECLGFLFGAIENLGQLARQIRLGVALLRVARNLRLRLVAEGGYTHAKLLQNRNDDPFVLREEGKEQMEVVNDRVARATRCRDGFVERFARFDREAVCIDHGPIRCNVSAPPFCQGG